MKKFLLHVILTAAALFATIALVNLYTSLQLPMATYFIVVGYALLALVLFRRITKAAQVSPKRFVTAVIASITIKLFAATIFVVIYGVMKGPGLYETAFSLFGIYLIFTLLLVRSVNSDITAH